jgi:hypothetical protein
MKKPLAVAACVFLAACGSSGTPAEPAATRAAASAVPVGTPKAAGTVEPTVELVQLIGPQQLNWEQGEIEMKYALVVTNRAAEAITLRQIQIQTVGVEGPYFMPQASYFFRENVAAGQKRDLVFFAKAYSAGNRYRIDAESPVSIRIVSFFEAPKGNFRKTFITNIGQSFRSAR